MPESESAGEISRLRLIRAGEQLNQERKQGTKQPIVLLSVATQATLKNVTNDVVFLILIIYKYTANQMIQKPSDPEKPCLGSGSSDKCWCSNGNH